MLIKFPMQGNLNECRKCIGTSYFAMNAMPAHRGREKLVKKRHRNQLLCHACDVDTSRARDAGVEKASEQATYAVRDAGPSRASNASVEKASEQATFAVHRCRPIAGERSKCRKGIGTSYFAMFAMPAQEKRGE